MRLELTVILWMLLNASHTSSFGTCASNQFLSSRRTHVATKLPFLQGRGGGGQTSASFGISTTSLSSSVESSQKQTIVSDANLQLLSERGRKALVELMESDVDKSQVHIYGDWPEPGVNDDDKRRLAEQVCICF